MSTGPDLAQLRRTIHADPEVGLHLPRTQATVLESLSGLDLEVHRGRELSSVVAVLHGARPGPTVLLRADMDALPLSEASDEPFSSRTPGAMHACGHDLHTAALVGAAHRLAVRREEWAGDVVFMFQPGEEFDDGASLMLAEGVLSAGRTPVSAAYALHCDLRSGTPDAQGSGVLATRSGPLLASADAVDVTLTGQGGHGGAPALTRDPIPALAAVISGLQTLVARTRPVEDPVVLSVGTVAAGVARNVVPDQASFSATLRSFSPEARSDTLARLHTLVHGIAEAHGVEATVTVEPGYPATINDSEAAVRMQRAASEVWGPDRVRTLAGPSGGSEDFARVLARVPGAMAMVDVTPADGSPVGPLHSATARFDDRWLPDMADVLARAARMHLTSDLVNQTD